MEAYFSQKITAVIITKNEEVNIKRCLTSIQWVDEIVVVDSYSTDKTVDICKQFDCNIILTEWLGFGPTKKLAMEYASYNWILSIDSDEQVTEELKNRITMLLENPQAAGYRIKRKSFYLGKIINYCGWNHDYPLRLFNKNYGNFNDKPIHESVVISGAVKKIEEPMLHYTYPTVQSHILKMDNYAKLGAERAFSKGKSATINGALVRGILKFIKMYFLQTGLLDGKHGFILALNSAFGTYLKYLKLWEKSK